MPEFTWVNKWVFAGEVDQYGERHEKCIVRAYDAKGWRWILENLQTGELFWAKEHDFYAYTEPMEDLF